MAEFLSTPVGPAALEAVRHDEDAREELLRGIIAERLNAAPPPAVGGHVVASYFFDFRTQTLTQAVAEIAYHATSGVKKPPAGSLLARCTAEVAGIDAFDATGRIGMLHIAYPLEMLLHPDGHVTSVDLLHTVAGAIIFDVYENRDAKLIHLEIPAAVLATFPGPAWGPAGVRGLARFPAAEPAFGTILKPTAGITPDDVGRLVAEVAGSPLLLFVKEDENLYPNLGYSPVAERTRRAVAAIEKARARRDGRGLVFAPHVTGAPHEIRETVEAVLEAGASAVMFSEMHAGGTVRMIREATRRRERPPALYGHNAGIGVRTRAIFREVIDFLARLDGIDFRQTAPVRPGPPFLKPYGAEWRASEEALTRPVPGIAPVMIARAGGLDQGNIILNIADAETRGILDGVLFLAGSAINSIAGPGGKPDPALGLAALGEALEVHRSGAVRDVPADQHLAALADIARRPNLRALAAALAQRYPGKVS